MSSCTLGTDPWAPVGTPLRQRESKSDTACASHQKLIDEQMIARGSPESNRLTAHSGHHIQGPRPHQSANTVASANKPTEIRPSAGRAGGISLRSPTSACDVATRGEGSGNAISSDGPRRFHCTSSTSTGDPILAASHQLLLRSAENECLRSIRPRCASRRPGEPCCLHAKARANSAPIQKRKQKPQSVCAHSREPPAHRSARLLVGDYERHGNMSS